MTEEEEKKRKEKDDAFIFEHNYQFAHLWVFDVETKEEKRLTEGEFSVGGFSLSRDGTKVLYAAAPTPLYDDSLLSEIWIMDLKDGSKKQITQNKIPEDLIINLNNILDFTIVKEIPLSQFDITKFAFLNELYQHYEGQYDNKKFSVASNQLAVPFNELLISIREDVDIKGLNIKLNSTLSNLSEIPQLMKHILYDFDSDFRNWNEVVIKKP